MEARALSRLVHNSHNLAMHLAQLEPTKVENSWVRHKHRCTPNLCVRPCASMSEGTVSVIAESIQNLSTKSLIIKLCVGYVAS